MKAPWVARPLAVPVLVCVLAAVSAVAVLEAAAPVVSNVRAAQRVGTGLVDIYYDVMDADGDPLYVTAEVSFNSGATYSDFARSMSGSGFGRGVAPGKDRQIVWNAGVDLDAFVYRHVRVKVMADDGFAHVPGQMAYVPAGNFAMGDTYGEGGTSERPVHTVYVSGFYVDKFEVSKDLWDRVRAWAVAQGYDFDGQGEGYGPTHPVQTVSWWDAVKWANARSESLGFTPCYCTDASKTTVYRTGHVDVANDAVRWDADGFRLPTEAEWEKAARGGLAGQHFPWPSQGGSYGAHIDCGKANYSPCKNSTTPVGYYDGHQTPAGPDMANGYGLYDMAGNVWEWVWDWYGDPWYGTANGAQNDTRGPGSGSLRVIRGGCWGDVPNYCRVASRGRFGPSDRYDLLGFRLVRGQL